MTEANTKDRMRELDIQSTSDPGNLILQIKRASCLIFRTFLLDLLTIQPPEFNNFQPSFIRLKLDFTS